MKPLTSTSYVLLGLLAVRSWTAYELAKQMGRAVRYFWPRAERKLYDEVKNLVAHGLATGRSERSVDGLAPFTRSRVKDGRR